ncbi:2189_t:CDS:1, partial [Funneliformis caledonium]
ARLDEATKNLKTFEEGENDRKWLNELRGKVRRKEQLDEDDKRQLERLEKEEERLKKNVNDWKNQTINLQNKLAEFGKGESNKQIA